MWNPAIQVNYVREDILDTAESGGHTRHSRGVSDCMRRRPSLGKLRLALDLIRRHKAMRWCATNRHILPLVIAVVALLAVIGTLLTTPEPKQSGLAASRVRSVETIKATVHDMLVVAQSLNERRETCINPQQVTAPSDTVWDVLVVKRGDADTIVAINAEIVEERKPVVVELQETTLCPEGSYTAARMYAELTVRYTQEGGGVATAELQGETAFCVQQARSSMGVAPPLDYECRRNSQ